MLSTILSFPGIIRVSRAGGVLCSLVGRWRDDCWLSNPRRRPRVPYGSAATSPAWFRSRRRKHTLDGKGASALGQASKIRRNNEPCLVRVPAVVLDRVEAEKHQKSIHSVITRGPSRQTRACRMEDSPSVTISFTSNPGCESS